MIFADQHTITYIDVKIVNLTSRGRQQSQEPCCYTQSCLLCWAQNIRDKYTNILVRRNETLYEICYSCDLFAESSSCCELKNINKIEEILSIYHKGGCVHISINTASILASLRARASTLFGFLPANLRAAASTCWYITPLAGVVPSSSSDQGNVLWRHEID